MYLTSDTWRLTEAGRFKTNAEIIIITFKCYIDLAHAIS